MRKVRHIAWAYPVQSRASAGRVENAAKIAAIKSVENSAITPRDPVNEAAVRMMLILPAESVCSRMRELVTPTYFSSGLADEVMTLFRENDSWEYPIRSIGLRGTGLVEACDCLQLSLYQDERGKP